MQTVTQTHNDHSIINLSKQRQKKLELTTNQSTISIDCSQIDLTIKGIRNRIKIEDTAGRFTIDGAQNQIQIRKSWISCEIEGDNNMFSLFQAEFQLKTHRGNGNFIPGYLGENPANGANRRLIMQERIINFRINHQRINSHTIKKYWPSLLRSKYEAQTRECAICYDDISAGDEVTSLFCFHFFHSACIEACLQTTTKCPVCSLDLLRYIHGQIKSGSFVVKENQLWMKESMEDEGAKEK